MTTPSWSTNLLLTLSFSVQPFAHALFFFNDTATTEIYTVSLHDALPISMPHATPGTSFPPNDTYTPAVLAALERCKMEGIEVIVFGDIFLEDLRAFRDGLLSRVDLEG